MDVISHLMQLKPQTLVGFGERAILPVRELQVIYKLFNFLLLRKILKRSKKLIAGKLFNSHERTENGDLLTQKKFAHRNRNYGKNKEQQLVPFVWHSCES